MYEKLYRELLLRYNALESENKRLSEENARLRLQFGFANAFNENTEILAIAPASINKYSSSKEKIELFRSLFHGSVNFLSFGTHEESIMRFENADIAGQLMDTVL